MVDGRLFMRPPTKFTTYTPKGMHPALARPQPSNVEYVHLGAALGQGFRN